MAVEVSASVKCPVRWLNAIGTALPTFKSPTFLVDSSMLAVSSWVLRLLALLVISRPVPKRKSATVVDIVDAMHVCSQEGGEEYVHRFGSIRLEVTQKYVAYGGGGSEYGSSVTVTRCKFLISRICRNLFPDKHDLTVVVGGDDAITAH